MPPIDHVPWLLGQGDVPLGDWQAHMTLTREVWVQSLPGPSSPCHIRNNGLVGNVSESFAINNE